MKIGQWVLGQKRLFFIIGGMLALLGVFSLSAVPKNEDPRLPDWFASIIVVLPGGEAEQIDEMIAKPINDRLKEIDELKKIETTTRMNVTSFQLEMKDSIRDTKNVWDKVRRVLDEVKEDFPSGTLQPQFFENANRLETILYVVSGDSDILKLKKAATELKQSLLAVPGTSKVIIHGDPQEEIQALFSHEKLQQLSIPHGQIVQKVAQANTGMPAGAIHLNGQKIPLIIPSRISTAEQVSQLRLMKGSGDPIELNQVAVVQRTARRMENRAYWNGEPAVFVGVIAQHPIEIVKFGEQVRKQVQKFETEILSKNIKVSEVSYNPDRTNERLKDLGINLLIGILTVGLILWIWMGWKVSFVVSLFVPIISLVGFFVYSATGGVLHQISLAAFVISLGQFIDNIIVIVEWMDNRIREGVTPLDAAIEAIDSFKKPMFFATGTNISAFIPMLASTGTTAEFTFSIPLVAIITMIAAFALALFVVPVFTGYLFQYFKSESSVVFENGPSKFISQFARAVAHKPLLFTGISLLAILLSAGGFAFVKKQFFPLADRNQFTIKMELPESTDASRTDAELRKMMDFLKTKPEVTGYAGFVGESIPRFYYNVGMGQWGPHIAEILVVTKEKSQNDDLIDSVHNFAIENLKTSFVVARNLEQGPPVPAPIEFKIYNENNKILNETASEVLDLFRSKNPNILSKSNLGTPVQRLSLVFNQDLSERFGLTENQLALALLSSTSGLSMTKYFEDGKTKDVRLIGPELTSIEELKNLPIRSTAYRNLKLKDLATIDQETSAPVIHRLNGEKIARIFGWPTDHTLPSKFVDEIQSAVQAIGQRNNVKIQVGGEIQGSGDANMAILKSIPLGIFILIICLLLEFNSIRKMMIILLSVPFVISGVTPGLLVGNAAFGFMSLLGVLALVGIVVNNSILLIESIDEYREKEFSVNEAIVKALETRTRPILLTAVTTIAGLLPMAFEESTLWPPLALAMISGLIGSTMITLIFVPSLYSLCFESRFKFSSIHKMNLATTSVVVLLVFFSNNQADARIYKFSEAIRTVAISSPIVQAQQADLERTESLAAAKTRAAFLPKVGLQVEGRKTHEKLTQTNPFGTFQYGKTDQVIGGVEITQPLFNLKEMTSDRQKLNDLEDAAKAQMKAEVRSSQREIIHLLIQLQKLKLTDRSLKSLEKSLTGIEKEVQKFANFGLRGKSDLLSVQIAISDNRADQVQVSSGQRSVKKAIQIHLPDFDDLEDEIAFTASTSSRRSDFKRPEIESLEAVISSQRKELGSIQNGHWPTIELKGRYNYADQGLLDQKDWFETAVVLKWALFEGGTRSALASAQAKEIQKYEKTRQAVEAKLEAEKLNIQGEVDENKYRSAAAESTLAKAAKARDEDRSNSKAGRVPLKDWLSSEIRYEQKKLELETLQLDKIRLQYDDLFAKGYPLD